MTDWSARFLVFKRLIPFLEPAISDLPMALIRRASLRDIVIERIEAVLRLIFQKKTTYMGLRNTLFVEVIAGRWDSEATLLAS